MSENKENLLLRYGSIGGILFALAVSPLFYDGSLVHVGELPKRYFLHVCLLASIAVFLFSEALSPVRRELHVSWALFPLALLGAYAIARFPFAENPFKATSSLIVILCWLALATVICRIRRGNAVIAELVLRSLLIGGGVTALIGCLQYWGVVDRYYSLAFPGSTFVNRNYAAHVSAVCFCILVVEYLQRGRHSLFGSRLLFWLLFTLLFLYINYALSRASLLAVLSVPPLVSGLLCLKGILRFDRRDFWQRIAIVVLGMLLLTVLSWYNPQAGKFYLGGELYERVFSTVQYAKAPPSGLVEELSTGEGNVYIDASSLGRLHGWKGGLRMLRDFWHLGAGPGQFEIFYPPYDADGLKGRFGGDRTILRFLHNDPLQFTIEYGLVGVLCLFSATGFFLLILRRKDLDWVTYASTSGLLALVLLSLLDGPFTKPVTQVYSAALVGLIIGSSNSIIMRIRTSTRWVNASFCMLLASLCVYAVQHYSAQYEAEKGFHMMNFHWHGNRAEEAYRHGSKVASLLPGYDKLGASYGDLLSNMGKYDEAKVQFLDVLEYSPHSYLSHLKLAAIYQLEGNYEVALKHYNYCLRLVPSKDSILVQCAQLLQIQAKYSDATPYLVRFTEVQPKERAGYLMLAYNYEKMEDLPHALRVVEQAINNIGPEKVLIEKREHLRAIISRKQD